MKKLHILVLSIVLLLGIGVSSHIINSQTLAQQTYTQSAPQQIRYIDVNPLSVVNNPYQYLNKYIRIRAKFDKFSTLGLDYKPALRPHEKYISFMIQRPDITNHNIPLSEFKIFLTKEVAEKHIDLDSGDEILFSGKVFSTALGDPWMDVDKFEVTNKVKKDTQNKLQ